MTAHQRSPRRRPAVRCSPGRRRPRARRRDQRPAGDVRARGPGRVTSPITRRGAARSLVVATTLPAARRARHGTDGRPPVLVAASSRPPSADAFLRKCRTLPRRPCSSDVLPEAVAAERRRHEREGEDGRRRSREDPGRERDAGHDLDAAVDGDEPLGRQPGRRAERARATAGPRRPSSARDAGRRVPPYTKIPASSGRASDSATVTPVVYPVRRAGVLGDRLALPEGHAREAPTRARLVLGDLAASVTPAGRMPPSTLSAGMPPDGRVAPTGAEIRVASVTAVGTASLPNEEQPARRGGRRLHERWFVKLMSLVKQ